jgi:GTP-binding protein EngB required for normal cell division
MTSPSNSLSSPDGDGRFDADGLLPPAVDFDSLRRYTSAKLSIAHELRSLLDLLKKRGDESRVHSCEQLMAKLAEDRFTIAVLGQFKRGKSSLINAIVGRNLLPTGILPLTSVITIVKFGARERLVIQRKGFQFPEHEPIASLPYYVTSQHNPENRKGIETVAVELPLPYLRRGLQFVDTPGVGSAIKANTDTTYSFLPNCDAALFVTSADGPLSEAELELLTAIRRYAGKIFFVLNKIDLLSGESEVIQVVKFLKSILGRALGVPEISLIPISAQKGLEASISKSASQFAGSGLLDLEKRLAQFLANERETVFLKSVSDHARRLLTEELDDSELRDHASHVVKADRDRQIHAIKGEFKRLETERREILDGIKDRLVQYVYEQVAEQLASFFSKERAAGIRRLALFVRVGGCRPAGLVAKRYATTIARRFLSHFSRWADQNEQCIVQRINRVTVDGLKQLRLNLNELAVLPRKAFGLAIAEPASSVNEEFGALALQPKLEMEAAESWSPCIPSSLCFWPTFIVGPWLRNQLQTELITFASRQQTRALTVIWRQLEDALRAHSVRVTEHAAILENRTMKVLSGGLDHVKEGFLGAKLPSYRDQLSAIYKNFSLIREQIHSTPKNSPGAPFPATRPIPAPNFGVGLALPVRAGARSDYTTRGCPVCDRLVALSKEFFVKFQYALYSDEQEQESFAESRGFCPFHTWTLEAISSPVGFSVGCAKLVRRISGLLAQMASSSESACGSLSQLYPEPMNCRVCSLVREAEQTQIKMLRAFLEEAAGKEVYARSQGVCLRHLEMLVKANPNRETIRFLFQRASTVFQLISEDMENFALKREATRRHLVSEDEEDAYLRAVIHLAGAKHNCAPWQYRDEF